MDTDALIRQLCLLIETLYRRIREEEQPPEFKEYGEDIADGIEVCKCQTCGHEHAAKKN